MVCYTIEIRSPKTFVTLPFMINRCRFIKIKKMMCKITSTQISYVIVQIPTYDINTFFDGVNNIPYTFIYFNDKNENMLINYINNTNFEDYNNCYSRNLQQFNIELITNNGAFTDVNVLNPMMIEFEFM